MITLVRKWFSAVGLFYCGACCECDYSGYRHAERRSLVKRDQAGIILDAAMLFSMVYFFLAQKLLDQTIV